ncbi:MAG: wax ester/triacylglycerol synthase family O-acyltransferase [Pseudomonadota bacterium]
MEQLQGLDASFVALERQNSPMHIGSILIYDPSTAPGQFVRFKDILSFFEARLRLSKTMRQKLVRVPFSIDYPYWVEDADFDLEYHIRHVALPKPGDRRQLCIQAARVFARPLDLTRPPWEITVVEGLDNIPDVPKGSFAMVTKVHHAAIDGLSGIDLMQATHTMTPDTAPPNVPDEWRPDRKPNPVGMFAKGYVRAWLNPIRQVGVAAQSVPGVYRAARGLISREFDLGAAISAPKTRFNATISPHRVVEGQSFPLTDIKAMRALSEGSKVNDVMLSIVGGGMRRYLEHKSELPKSTLTAMAPISVRSDGEKNKMGNQVAAMIAPLGTHIADPAERLAYVHAETRKSKAMTNALGARQMTEASKVSPALFMALGAQLYSRLGLGDMMKPVVNTIVTNVPGPPVPIYSCGAQLVSMHGLLCLVDGVGIGHVVQSYMETATIAFTACRNIVPDPEFYAQCIYESYADYAKACGLVPAKMGLEKSADSKPKTKRKTKPRASNSTLKSAATSRKATAKRTAATKKKASA